MNGAERIAAERKRQIEVEGWTEDHDDKHVSGVLAKAAECYQLNDPTGWPWEPEWWKPRDAEDNLVRAGALYQAEIDRLERLRGECALEIDCLVQAKIDAVVEREEQRDRERRRQFVDEVRRSGSSPEAIAAAERALGD